MTHRYCTTCGDHRNTCRHTVPGFDLDSLRRLVRIGLYRRDGTRIMDGIGAPVAHVIDIEYSDTLVDVANALPALLADHARLEAEVATFKRERDEARSELDYPHRLSALNRENAESARVYEERWDAARAELTAERDAHHATCDALARERAEVANLRGSVESYMAMLDDANVDRSAALVRAERIEAESEAEVERLEQELVEAQSRESTAQEIHNESAAQWHAEVARLTAHIENDVTRRRTVIEAVKSMPAVDAELDAAKAEVARLRGLVERACDGWQHAAHPHHQRSWSLESGRIAAIREESAGE